MELRHRQQWGEGGRLIFKVHVRGGGFFFRGCGEDEAYAVLEEYKAVGWDCELVGVPLDYKREGGK